MKKQNESSIDLLLDQIPLAVGENYYFFFLQNKVELSRVQYSSQWWFQCQASWAKFPKSECSPLRPKVAKS